MNIFRKGKSKRIGFQMLLCILVFFGAGGISVQAAKTVDPSNPDEETLSYFYDYSPESFTPEGGEEAIETIHVTLAENFREALEKGTDFQVSDEEGVCYTWKDGDPLPNPIPEYKKGNFALSYMFASCGGQREDSKPLVLDLSLFDTSKVLSMLQMFMNCQASKIDVSKFDVSNVYNMEEMFYGCSNVTVLDISGWKTESLTKASGLFRGCNKLTALDLKGLKTGKVTDMNSMFSGCNSLNALTLEKDKFITKNVTDMSYMFAGCFYLEALDLSGFDTSNVNDASYMFNGDEKLSSITFGEKVTMEKNKNFSYMFNYCKSLTELDLTHFDTASAIDMNHMFCDCSALTTITGASGLKTGKAQNMNSMFYNCQELSGNPASSFDVKGVTDMGSMFYGCVSLMDGEGALDLSNFNPAYITDVSHMFSGLKNHKAIDIRNMELPEDTDLLSQMFDEVGCELTASEKARVVVCSQDIKVYIEANKDKIYPNTDKIEFIGVANPSNMSEEQLSAFYTFTEYETGKYKASLTDDFRTALVSETGSLKTADETYEWKSGESLPNPDTKWSSRYGKVTSFKELFKDVTAENIDVSLFAAENVTDYEGMFAGCGKLAALDLSSLNISAPATVTDMLKGTCADNTGAAIEGVIDDHNAVIILNDSTKTGIDPAKLTFIFRPMVTFDLNGHGGSSVLASVAVDYDTPVSKPTNTPYDYDWKFLGWYTSKSPDLSTEKAYDFSAKVTESMTLYACWEQSNLSEEQLLKFYKYEADPNGSGLKVSLTDALQEALRSGTGSISAEADGDYKAYTWTVGKPLPNPKSVYGNKYVTSMEDMFADPYGSDGGYKAELIDLSLFDTSNVTSMKDCFRFVTGDAFTLQGIDTSKVTDMSYMFYCSSLGSIVFGSDVDTSSVTNAEFMFASVTGLKKLDITSLDFKSVKNMSSMIYNCVDLEQIEASGFIIPEGCDASNILFNTGSALNVEEPVKVTVGNKHTADFLNSDAAGYAPAYRFVTLYNDVKALVASSDTGKGAVTADKIENVKIGDKVTLTVTPAGDHTFCGYDIISPKGLTIASDNTFIMPDEDVEIVACFHEHIYGNHEEEKYVTPDTKYNDVTYCDQYREFYKSCDICGMASSETFEGSCGTQHGEIYIEGAYEPHDCEADGIKKYYYCVHCGKRFFDEGATVEITEDNENELTIPAKGHIWVEDGTIAEANCTSEGRIKRHCSICDKEDYKAIPKVPHNLTSHEKKEATDTEDGWEAYWTCTECGKYFSDASGEYEIHGPVTINATSHTHSIEKVVAVPAGCETDGKAEHWMCTGCGKLFSDASGSYEITNRNTLIIPATGHDWDEGTVQKQASCKEEGEILYTCKNDSTHTYSKIIPHMEHEWDGGFIIEEPGCTTPGAICFTCINCGEAEEQQIDPVGHSMSEHPKEKATCASEGKKAYYECGVCGKFFEDNDGLIELSADELVIPEDGTAHDWGEWVTVAAPTADSEGKQRRTCQLDSTHTEERTVPVLGHVHKGALVVAKEASCEDAGNKAYYRCEGCGWLFEDEECTKEINSEDVTIPALGHNFDAGEETTPPTCKEQGVKTYTCTLCGKTKTASIPTRTHSISEVGEKSPTCTEDGNIACYQCSMCEEYFEDALGEKAIEKDKVVIPATGHDWILKETIEDSNCVKTGKGIFECQICGEEKEESLPLGSHMLERTEKKAPTANTDGYEEYYICSVCKKLFADSEGKNEIAAPKVIQKTGSGQGDTGNDTNNAAKDQGGADITGKSSTSDDTNPDDKSSDDQSQVKEGESLVLSSGNFKGVTGVFVVSATGDEPAVIYAGGGDKNAKTFDIPDTVTGADGKVYKVTSIAPNAFKGYKKLNRITLGNNIRSIGKNAFKGCIKLKTVKLDSKLEEIGAGAFDGCKAVKSITIPAKLKIIGKQAFSGCKSLKTIKIKSTSLNKVGAKALKGIHKKCVIKVPKSKLKAYKKLFKGKGQSKTVKVIK